jgi:molecular chaperone GrpE
MNDPKPTNGQAHDETHDDGAQDARPMTRAEERIAAIDTSPSALMEQLAELQVRAEVAEAEVEAVRADLEAVKARELRTAADFANYRRRAEEEKYAGQASANEALLRKVLGIADDLARALEHVPEDQQASPWVEGVEAIERKLVSALESEGVTAIVAVDQPFDPRLHEAVSMEPTDRVSEGTVTRELVKGYQLRDRVLRPSLVVVATPPTSND